MVKESQDGKKAESISFTKLFLHSYAVGGV